jgi:uncharacterized protein YndB with AHSA1/START domain
MKPDLTEHNGRHRLRMHRHFDQRENVVWRALVDPQLLSRWYPATVIALDPHPGGRIQFRYPGPNDNDDNDGNDKNDNNNDVVDAAMLTAGEVTEFAEPTVFAFVELASEDMPREGDSLLRFELRRDVTGSMLLFTQEFDDRPAAAAYAAGWDSCFDALENVLNAVSAGALEDELEAQPKDAASSGQATSGSTSAPTADRHEMYVHLFGLDKPIVGATQVTIERQLMMQSPEKIWQLLAPAGTPALERLVPEGFGAGRVVEVGDGERVIVALPDRSRVEWELSTGPGGARLTVTHGPLHRVDVGTQWRAHVESFVDEAYATP